MTKLTTDNELPLLVQTLTYTDARFRYCRQIREQVFVHEQQVPVSLEWDAADASATHLLAWRALQPVACARLLPDGHVGRMAVLPVWRRQGIGRALLQRAIALCQQQALPKVQLSAQTHAVAFYQRSGFQVVSAPYLDANIPHVDMELELL